MLRLDFAPTDTRGSGKVEGVVIPKAFFHGDLVNGVVYVQSFDDERCSYHFAKHSSKDPFIMVFIGS